MASIQKRGDKWRVFVLVDGKRRSATFRLRKEAVAWGNEMEEEGALESCTFRELINKYRPIAKSHRGSETELGKLNMIERKSVFIDLPIEYITKTMIAAYRDSRLKEVSPGTVSREMTILSSMFKLAVNEWELLRKSPMVGVAKPTCPEARHRGVSKDEEEAIIRALEAKVFGKIVAQMFQLSLETGLRMSEMINLTWDRVHDKYVTLIMTKNGSRRDVPLSIRAREIIEARRGLDDTHVFPTDQRSATSTFIKAKKRTPYIDVRFHDARSEAVTRLSKKMDVLQLAKMIGHKDINSLMFYYAESAESLADRL